MLDMHRMRINVSLLMEPLVKKLLSVLASLAMVASLLAASATPVAAADTDNLAGRPYNGNAATECQGTIYGRVNNAMVLFTANHCRGNRAGDPVYNKAGKRIGQWTASNAGNSGDLTWIVLDTGMYPASNRNYVTANGSTFVNRKTMPTVPCSALTFPRNMMHYWQPTLANTYAYRLGSATGKDATGTYCTVKTNLSVHTGYKDSGSLGVISQEADVVFGVAWYEIGGKIVFGSWYQAIRDVDAAFTGTVKFCSDSDC